jgi:hypothetical protein
MAIASRSLRTVLLLTSELEADLIASDREQELVDATASLLNIFFKILILQNDGYIYITCKTNPKDYLSKKPPMSHDTDGKNLKLIYTNSIL